MTSRRFPLLPWKRSCATLLVTAWLTCQSTRGAPSPDGSQGKERWLADGSFYDYEYMQDRPQADWYGGPVSSDLCPPVLEGLLSGGCEAQACSSDRECAESQLKCCYNGCVYTCLPEVKPPAHFDWIKEPNRQVQFGPSWLIPGPSENLDVELCSTTPAEDDSDPLVCPHGYECVIDDPGNPRESVPNRGRCVQISDDITPASVPSLAPHSKDGAVSDGQEENPYGDTASLHACNIGDQKILLSGHSLFIGGQECLCNETRLICDTSMN